MRQDRFDIRSIALQILRRQVSAATPLPGLYHDPIVHLDAMGRELVMALQSAVLGEEMPSQILRVPANWWEHFKERFFPAVWLDIWPVEYTCYLVSFQATYPKFKPALPEEVIRRCHEVRVKKPDRKYWEFYEVPSHGYKKWPITHA